MTVISSTDARIPGFPKFRKKISYDPKKKQFSIELPPFMAALLGKDRVTADTQILVEKEFEKAVEDTRKVHVEIQKVIVYQVEGHSVDTHAKWDSYSKDAILIRASVANMRQSKIGGRTTTTFETLESSLPSFDFGEGYNTFAVDYSPELEAFFHNLVEDLHSIKNKLLARGTFTDDYRYKLR
jgi:hypothetical protein